MARHSFFRISKLPNVKGRIDYISSPDRQENLYATYQTADTEFWKNLAFESQQEFRRFGTEGKCIEARELIIALPEVYTTYDPQEVLTEFTEEFYKRYGVECVSALHHNKRMTNYHIHLKFSERTLLPEPDIKIASRSVFYDETGKRVRTKKEITGEDGNIRPGCTVIKKGEVYEQHMFTPKDERFKDKGFLHNLKEIYTDLINRHISDPTQQLRVFDPNGVYLATKKIGKNNPKADQIQADNEISMSWNREVDRAILSEVPDAEIREIKTRWITKRIKNHITILGEHPTKYASVILYAIDLLAKLITNTLAATKAMKEKLILTDSPIETPETEQSPTITIKPVTDQEDDVLDTISHDIAEIKPIEPVKPHIPPKPEMSLEAAAYEKLHKYWIELDRQNDIIFEAEKQRNSLEFERDNLKGLAKLTKKKEFDSKITQKNEQIEILKIGLSNMVKNLGFANMGDFYLAYHTSRQAYYEYHDKVEIWEKTYGETSRQQTESIRGRLQELKEEANKQDTDPFNYHHSSRKKDRGAR